MGDVDGDGLGDLMIRSYDGLACDAAGTVYLYLGATLVGGTGFDSGQADAVFEGEWPDHYAGTDSSFIPDLDGDGRDEVLIGAPGAPSGAALSGRRVYFSAPGEFVRVVRVSDPE